MSIEQISEKVTKWKEIDEETFDEQLDMMPPIDWHRETNSESFKLLEEMGIGISRIYLRRGHAYYQFDGPTALTHQEIVEIGNYIWPL
jgi:hypothetical protein